MFYKNQLPKHLYSLDIVRGLAALVVVLWHWQHLLYVGGVSSAYRMEDQPFYSALSIFYHDGWRAVDFFFSLSGFVFFWLYAESVASKRISGFSFFVMRFSRLYPLHAATFLFVLIAQFFIQSRFGSFFVYENNGLYQAILSLFMATSWVAAHGYSFNGPIWSVSVEVILYIVFFAVCLIFKRRYFLSAICAVIGLLVNEVDAEIGRGLFSFFIGAIAFLAYSKIAECRFEKILTCIVTVITVFLWVGVAIEYRCSFFSVALSEILSQVVPASFQTRIPGIIYRVYQVVLGGFVFPCSIIALALLETWVGGIGKKLSFIGNLSYSSYLLHFPLQILFFVISVCLGIDPEFFYSGYSILLFFSILVPVCLASYHYFEVPMQRFIRGRLSPKRVELCAGESRQDVVTR